MKTFSKIIKTLSCHTVIFLMGLITFYLFLLSIFSSSRLDVESEHTYFLYDSPIKHFIVLFLFFFGLMFIKMIKKNYNIKISHYFCTIIFILISVFYFFWISLTRIAPMFDQACVLDAAIKLAHGDFYPWQSGGYLKSHPNQNGFVFFITPIAYFFGKRSYLIVQYMNLFSHIISCYIIYKICLRFSKKNADIIMLFTFAYFPFSFYTTYVYGNIVGLTFSILSFYSIIKYIETPKFRYLISLTVFALLAVLVKQNYLIYFVAAAIFLLINFLINTNFKNLIAILFLLTGYIAFTLFFNSIIHNIPTNANAKENGLPFISYVAMGLQEDVSTAGWCNDYHILLYTANKYDTELTASQSRLYINDRLKELSASPLVFVSFFSKKIASQWNNATFECFWIQAGRSWFRDFPACIKSIIFDGGGLNDKIYSFLNYFQSIILMGILLYVLFRNKNMEFLELFPALFFIGGFLFHLIWEAKCQYTVPYLFALLPYSVIGWKFITSAFADKYCPIKKNELVENKYKLLPSVKFLLFFIFLILIVLYVQLSDNPYILSTIKLHGDEIAYNSFRNEAIKFWFSK